MRAIVIDAMIVAGLGSQGVGIYLQFGIGWAAIVVGTELAVMGLMGANK